MSHQRRSLPSPRRCRRHRDRLGSGPRPVAGEAAGTSRHRREAGFTLVEVLVAFAMLSIVMLSLFGGLSAALQGDGRAEFVRIALRLAKTELEITGVSNPLSSGVTTGRFDNGMQWQRSVTPYALGPGHTTAAYWVEIMVHPSSGPSPSAFAALAGYAAAAPSVTLTTLKLVGSRQ